VPATATPAEIARRALADHLAALPPGELLSRYAARRDPEAFAGLVHQFGPLVLGTCRRVLGSSDDADDAFQAVFLALARQAGSFRDPQALPAWLHRVSLRVARKALGRRPAQPVAFPDSPEPADPSDPFADLAWKDVRRVLDEEVDALREKYRGPVVLCWLDGLTQDEAAGRLGVSLNTLKRRLEAGRTLLRSRLARRGLAPVLAPAAVATPTGLRAVVPGSLRLLAVELGVGGDVPAGVRVLEVVVPGTAPAHAYLKAGLALALVAGIATAGVIATRGDHSTGPPADPPPEAAKQEPPSRFDALGDPLPPRALFRVGTDRFRLPGRAAASLLSPDAKRLAVVNARPETVTLVDVESGRILWGNVPGGSEGYFGLAFAPDGTRLFVLDRGAVLVFDADTGRTLNRFVRPDAAAAGLDGGPAAEAGYGAVWFPPRSAHLFVRAGAELRALDAQTGEAVRKLATPGWPIAVGPDGSQAYALLNMKQNFSIKLCNAVAQLDRDGREVRQYSAGPDWPVVPLLSPDGGRLALVTQLGELRVYDTATGKELVHRGELVADGMTAPKVEGGLPGFHGFTPDSKTLLGADGEGVWEFDLAAERLHRRFRWPEGTPAPGSSDLLLGPNSVGGADPRRLVPKDGGEYHPLHLAGRVLVRLSAGDVERWDLETGKQLPPPAGFGQIRATRSADGRVIAAADLATGRVEILDGRTGQLVRQLQLAPDPFGLLLSADGSSLLAMHTAPTQLRDDGTVVLGTTRVAVWDTATGRERPVALRDPGGEVVELVQADRDAVALSPDGATVALVGAVRLEPPKPGQRSVPPVGLRVHDVATGKRLWEAAPGAYPDEFSPDGRLLGCISEGALVFHEARTGREVVRFDTRARAGEGANPPKMALKEGGGSVGPRHFSPGGGLGGWYDGDADRVRIVRLRTGKPPAELRPVLTGEVRVHLFNPAPAFSFGPNGVWIAIAKGNSVVLWDVATGTPIEQLDGHRAPVTGVEFGRDGRVVLSTSADRTALAWGVDPAVPGAARTPEQIWADLAGEAAAAFRAVWEAAAHPELPKFLREKLQLVPGPDERDSTADHWRQKRAVLAMELAGTPEAKGVLEAWAGGAAGAVLTEDAKASLLRLSSRPMK
jgi:RNA polymerase sigma factor (sigma-70 family)